MSRMLNLGSVSQLSVLFSAYCSGNGDLFVWYLMEQFDDQQSSCYHWHLKQTDWCQPPGAGLGAPSLTGILNPSLDLWAALTVWPCAALSVHMPQHQTYSQLSLHPHNWHKVNIKSKYAQIFPLFVEITEFRTTAACFLVHFWLVRSWYNIKWDVF